MTELLEAALRHAAQGRPVFPCRPRLKVPATAHGVKDATTDEGLIRAWWDTWPDANPAVATGRRSGVLVVDCDGEEGLRSVCELERANTPLPPTASVRTPGGGLHLWVRHPGGALPNTVRKLGPGLDTRGDGGYVLVPPALGPSGRRYRPEQSAPLAPAPRWLLDKLTGPKQGQRSRQPAEVWVSLVRDGLPAGERNHGLARLVGHLLAKDVDVRLVAEIAHLVNGRFQPPLDGLEVDRVIDSIAAREVRRRIGARP